MLIREVIQKVKEYHKGIVFGKPIDEKTTRDQILYGDPNQECSGIVTTCWASVDVIRQAAAMKANLIIVHEALFWNHGDHTEWLETEKNKTFTAKKKLLDDAGIVVWRDHDYIHSGIPMAENSYTDGIFYGVANKLGWIDYIVESKELPMYFEIPETTVRELAEYLIQCFHLDGVKILGDVNQRVSKIRIPMHILGDAHETITEMDQKGIDCLLTMELIDFTAAEYIRDSSMLGLNKAIIAMGHFNLEEPGMEYMVNYLKDALKQDIPCRYIQSGDMYHYIVSQNRE